MVSRSFVLYPPPQLAGCLSIAIVRDTRAVSLSDADRFNYFPATPLMALTLVLQGPLRMSSDFCDLTKAQHMEALPAISVLPPQDHPTQSWSDGPVHAITVGIFPDAWTLLGGNARTNALPDTLRQAAADMLDTDDIHAGWARFCTALEPLWRAARQGHPGAHWAGSHRVADWTRHLLTRVALSGAGQSARSLERRMKRWTGQSKRKLNQYSQLETLYGLRLKEPGASLAAIAAEANYSDQSHMGRAVKKTTGFSPAQLNALIETEESFWCYRLLGERL